MVVLVSLAVGLFFAVSIQPTDAMKDDPTPEPHPESPVTGDLKSPPPARAVRSPSRRIRRWCLVLAGAALSLILAGAAALWIGRALTQGSASLPPLPVETAPGPSLVSLHLNNTPLRQAMEELAKQAGVEIAISRDFDHLDQEEKQEQEKKMITLDLDRQPFWEAVRQLCAQCDWKPEEFDCEGRCLTLAPEDRWLTRAPGGGGWVKRPVKMESQFMVMATGVKREQTLQFGDPHGPSRTFSIFVEVFADPKMKIVDVNPWIDVAVATDDNGNSLAASMGGRIPGRFTGRQSPMLRGLFAPLQIRPGIGKKLVELSGVARLKVQTKSQIWDLGDPLKIAKEQRRAVNDKVTLTVKRVSPAAHGPGSLKALVKVTIKGKGIFNFFGPRADDGDPLTNFEFLQGCLKVVDAKGRPFRGGMQSGSRIGNTWEYSLSFSPPDDLTGGGKIAAPARMIWDLPVEIKEVAVPVEFKDLPLP